MNNLIKQIESLEAWRASLEEQQLTYPLDGKSKDLIYENTLVPTGNFVEPAGLATYAEGVEVQIKNRKFLLTSTVLAESSVFE